jgi:membrane protein implicated in regulation of membrane protease activity
MMQMIQDHPALPWLLAGLALMLMDSVMPGAFLLWVGLAAILTGLVLDVVSIGFPVQVMTFAVFAVLSIVFALRLRRRRRPSSVNTPGSGLVGRIVQPLSHDGREGRVRLGDSDWSARLIEGADWPGDAARLRVVGVEGTVLIVQPEMSEA